MDFLFNFDSNIWYFLLFGFLCSALGRLFYSYVYRISKSLLIKISGTERQITDYNENDYDEHEGEENVYVNDEDYDISNEPQYKQIPFVYKKFNLQQTKKRASEFYQYMNMRRTVRHFSDEPVPIEVIRNIIKAAGTAPSGAHCEPWTFIAVSDQEIKEQIREIIEREERINYERRMGTDWVNAVKPLNTNWIKEYLTDAPYLILVFKQTFGLTEEGKKKPYYYHEISVNIAVGILLAAVHFAGLVALVSTPMYCASTLHQLLERPKNEKLITVIPVGYPLPNCLVPDLKRKNFDEIMIEI